MKLAEKIYMLRKRQGMSQEQLSDTLGVSRQAVSKWEVGESVPELDKLPLLCSAFGVSADYLLSEEMEEPAPALQPASTHKQKEAFIACMFLLVVGLITAWAGWYTWQSMLPVAIGFCIQACACGCYEAAALAGLSGSDADALRRRFYAVAVWLLLPVPAFVLCGIVFSYRVSPYSALTLTAVSVVLYLILSLFFCLLLTRKKRG